MRKALATSFASAVTTGEIDTTLSICEDFWTRCTAMIVSEYRRHIGPDYAG